MTFQAIFFDLDDTLLNTTSSLEAAWKGLESRFALSGVSGAEAKLRAIYERYAFEEWTLGEGPDHYETAEVILQRAWERTLKEMPLQGFPGAESLSTWTLDEMTKAWDLFEDVEPMMPAIHPPYRLAIVTNGGNTFQHRKFDLLRLNRWFEAIFVAEECLAAKPNPEHFLFACRHLGVDPHRCLMVGDNLKRDVEGALGAGLSAVWLNRTARYSASPLPEAAGLITTLSDLPAWIAEVEKGGNPPKWWTEPTPDGRRLDNRQ